MNIHKCNEAARWKAEVLQMMWACANNHAAGATATAREDSWDTTCLECNPFGGATPLEVPLPLEATQPSDATSMG